MTEPTPIDPIRQRRARIARLVQHGKRVGYSLFGISIVAFVIGFFAGYDGVTGTTVVVGIVIGSLLLAPAIVFGYAVKAAERDDRERGF